jgi:DNA-binding transcriptional regulator YiaG
MNRYSSADLRGVTENTVNRWERGARQGEGPAVATIRELAKKGVPERV